MVRWDDAKALVHAALDLEPAEREAFLRHACTDAPELMAEARSLLTWIDDSQGFLEIPAVRLADLHPLPGDADPLLGQCLGPWRVLSILGRGGMGVVYRAERADAAFRRIVAIKVMARSAPAAGIIERFQRERQTHAALEHRNIAHLIDGGSTADDKPYFVMEHVEGVPVDRYCDENHLTIEQRLELFVVICGAVQYAHQALVVHRDIKPDNILVTSEGIPKLLDFGIAQVVSSTRGQEEKAQPTSAWMMTPDYASPEQVAGEAVTTATDVYSLGVLLYVLLTGQRPFQLTATSRDDLERQMQAATLIPPSARVSTGALHADRRAAARRSTAKRLRRRLKGDLDAIVARALARNVRDRYGSVEQLADEIERHRLHRPVAARGSGVAYVAGAFARRHRVALTMMAVMLLTVCAGGAIVLWQASVAAAARAQAERRFNDVRRLANTFIFDVHDEIVNVPGTTRARALMLGTASAYLEGLTRESAGDVALRRELASAFVRVGDAQGHPTSANIGDSAGARASYQRAIEVAGGVLGDLPADLDAARTRALANRRLSDLLAWSGDMPAALSYLQTSQRQYMLLSARPDAAVDDRLQTAVAELKLADLQGNPNLPNFGRTSEATSGYAAARSQLDTLASAAPGHAQVQRYRGIVFERIGTLHERARDWSAAAAAYEESFAIRAKLAAAVPLHADIQRDLAIAHEKLGNVRLATGDSASAEVSYRGALDRLERLAAADPVNVTAARSAAVSRERLATTVGAQGRANEAHTLLEEALVTHRELARRDTANVQARCDEARVVEAIGDTARLMPTASRRVACAHWSASLDARQQLLDARVACASTPDVAQLRAKMKSCL